MEPVDMEKPRTWNDKELGWCSTKTGGKCNLGEYLRHLPSKCTGSDKNRGGGDSSQSRGKNLRLEREMLEVIDHEYDPE